MKSQKQRQVPNADPDESTDAQYGTHSTAAHPDTPTGPNEAEAEASQPMQRPGGANPSAQSSTDWQVQRGDVPDVAEEQQRANQASPGRVSQTLDGDVTVDPMVEGKDDRAKAGRGDQGPGEAHGHSKFDTTANQQDRLSRERGGAPLRARGKPRGR